MLVVALIGQMGKTDKIATAVHQGSLATAVPRLLALLCILSVFIPAFIMTDPLRSLFMPLTLGVGFAMISSYLLSSTFVPIMCVTLLRHKEHGDEQAGVFGRLLVRDLHPPDGLLPVAEAGADLHRRGAGAIAGIATILYVTGTTLNIESFMGSIMCLGISVSNSVMLVTFMDEHWKAGSPSSQAAMTGAGERLRPILMTACAMRIGMVPMALALERGS